MLKRLTKTIDPFLFLTSVLIVVLLRNATPILIALICLAIVYRACIRREGRAFGRAFQPPLMKLMIVFCVYSLCTSPWSTSPGHSAAKSLALLGCVVMFGALSYGCTRLSEHKHRRLLHTLYYVLLTALGLLLLQLLSGHTIRSIAGLAPKVIKKDCDLLIIILFPALLVLSTLGKRPHLQSLVVVMGVLAACVMSTYAAGVLGLIVGLLIMMFTLWRPRWAWNTLKFGSVGYLLTLPTLLKILLTRVDALRLVSHARETDAMLFSFYHRLAIWQHVLADISQHPLLGHGLDVGKLPPPQVPLGRNAEEMLDLLPCHPHNFVMQLWLDSGLVGVAIAAVLFYVLFDSMRRRSISQPHGKRGTPQRYAHCILAGYIATLMVVQSASHSLWAMWLFMPAVAVGILLWQISCNPERLAHLREPSSRP